MQPALDTGTPISIQRSSRSNGPWPIRRRAKHTTNTWLSKSGTWIWIPKRGVIRNATFVESSYCCIFVTPDNVTTLLQSTDQAQTQRLCKLILEQMRSSLLLDLLTLVEMEEAWTGGTRKTSAAHLPQMRFYSVISCTNYLSEDWHQVRELYVIAIAEGAWDAIAERSRAGDKRAEASRPCVAGVLDKTLMLTTVQSLLAGTPAETLLASIIRRAVKIGASPKDEGSSRLRGDQAAPYDGLLRDIVHYIYRSFKRGSRKFESHSSDSPRDLTNKLCFILM